MIGLNLLYLLPGIVGGTETYAAGLLSALAKAVNRNNYIVYLNKESEKWPIPQISNIRAELCPVNATNRGRRYLYEQLFLPRLLEKHKVDVIHSLGYVGPLWAPCPSIVTIHDLNFIDIGHNMPFIRRHVLKNISTRAAHKAKFVITVSNYSKSMICEKLNIEKEKVVVTSEGPPRNESLIHQESDKKILMGYQIRGSYIAAFCGGHEHKNIMRLIQAFMEARKTLKHKLVLIGHTSRNIRPSQITDNIITTGYIPTAHVLPLLRSADVFVFPSLYEGFGLPVLEAQKAGVPIVCSNAGALPEVAGNGALFFDPSSVPELVEKIIHVAQNSNLRAELIKRGTKNLLRFSWEKTAMATMAVYMRSAEFGNRH